MLPLRLNAVVEIGPGWASKAVRSVIKMVSSNTAGAYTLGEYGRPCPRSGEYHRNLAFHQLLGVDTFRTTNRKWRMFHEQDGN